MRHKLENRAICLIGELVEHKRRFGFGGNTLTHRRVSQSQNLSLAQAYRVIRFAVRLGYIVPDKATFPDGTMTYNNPHDINVGDTVIKAWDEFKDKFPDLVRDILPNLEFREMV